MKLNDYQAEHQRINIGMMKLDSTYKGKRHKKKFKKSFKLKYIYIGCNKTIQYSSKCVLNKLLKKDRCLTSNRGFLFKT